MRQIFKSKHRITQKFANKLIVGGKDYYAQFGLKGHEGLDLVPTGTQLDVFSLADGVVVRDEDNAKSGSYGINCTIWSPTLNIAFQYCHLSSNTVREGELVKAGQTIGFMGGTGNTMGNHLHLNKFNTDSNGVRQNRDNGYLGGVDPLPFLEKEPEVLLDVYTDLDKCRVTRDGHWNDLQAIKSKLKLPGEYSITTVLAEIEKLISYEDAVRDKDKKLNEFQTNLAIITGQLKGSQTEAERLKTENLGLETRVNEQMKHITELEGTIDNALSQIDTLEKQSQKPFEAYSGIELISKGLNKLLGR